MVSDFVPKWLNKYLDKSSLTEIEAAVVEAEKTTSCEIVPMIVRSSASTEAVPRILFLFLFILFFAFDAMGYLRNLVNNTYLLLFGSTVVIGLVSTALGRIRLLQMLLISNATLENEVSERAEIEFYRAGLHGTRHQVGILIFLSLAERRVVVLADKGIAEKLPGDTWNRAVELVLTGRRMGRLGKGVVEAIDYCGSALRKDFPKLSSDINELRDHLIFKE